MLRLASILVPALALFGCASAPTELLTPLPSAASVPAASGDLEDSDDDSPSDEESAEAAESDAPAAAPATRQAAPTERGVATPFVCQILQGGHLDTMAFPGAVFTSGTTVPSDLAKTTSLGRQGDDLFLCRVRDDGRGVVTRIAGDNHNDTNSGVPCDAVTADDLAIVVHSDQSLDTYATWEDVLAGTAATHVTMSSTARVLAPFYDQLVGAPNPSSALEKFRWTDATSLGTVQLERDAAPLAGISTLPDGRVVVSKANSIDTFDLFTGALLEHFADEDDYVQFGALNCRASAQ